jgi:CARDB
MKTVLRFTLSAGAVALVCACTSDGPQQPISEPLRASFSDGAHDGNPDFFFLPPLFKSPSSDPHFSPGEFNASVQPSVEICELAALVPPATIRECGATIETFAGSAITLDVANEQYRVNWNTDQSNLVLTKEYRIRVLLGTQELGYADVDPVSTGSQLRNVETGENIGLIDGRTLPIKFRVENGAACLGGTCNTKTIELDEGGFVVLETTGDRVDIPPQASGQVVTVTVQLCDDIDVDLPVFGNCLRVTANPRLAAPLFPRATVSICSIDPPTLPLTHEQSDLLTLHRQDDEIIQALPHSDDFCGEPIGRRDAGPTNFAARGWRAVRDIAAWIFKPATLHATTMVLDVGAGGETESFSDFQFALPAKMELVSPAEQATEPNTPVPAAPAVRVTDADGNPVANARVHFQITSTGGGSLAPEAGVVFSNAAGRAALSQWTVGAAGVHSVQAFGKGIADPENNGPAEGFEPFAPRVFHNPEQNEAQAPVTLETGRLEFHATAGLADLIIETLIQLPASPTDFDAIEYTAVVKNIGSAAVSRVAVQIDVHEVVDGKPGRQIETTTLAGPFGVPLNPGESTSLRRQRSLELNGGTYQLAGTVDPGAQVPESDEGNNTALTRFAVAATGELLVRPATPLFGSPSGVDLPLNRQNGISIQGGAGIQLEVLPAGPVVWTSIGGELGTVGSVNATGVVAIVRGNEDPATAHEMTVTATGESASDEIKINSFAFDHFPRLTALIWRPVAGAATYEVQIEFGNDCAETAECDSWFPTFQSGAITAHTGFVTDFVGAQPGRWRVAARDASGAVLSTSAYVYFRYSI